MIYMAVIDTAKQETILRYLSVEGFAASAIVKLRKDIISYLTSNGHTVSMAKTPFKTNGATSAWIRNNVNAMDDKTIKATFYDGQHGLENQAQAFKYGSLIRESTGGPHRGYSTKATPKTLMALPKRTIKASKWDYNGMMPANLLSIATTGQPTAQWMLAAEEVANGLKTANQAFNLKKASYKYKVGSGLGTVAVAGTPSAATIQTPAKTKVSPSKTIDSSSDTNGAGDGSADSDNANEIDDLFDETLMPEPAELSPNDASGSKGYLKDPEPYDSSRFPKIVPPTADEEIALSGKQWELIQASNEGYYPYSGVLFITCKPAAGEAKWQPYTSTITSSTDVGSEESLDELFDNDALDDLTVSDEDTTPYFTTPTCTFAFQEGMNAVFKNSDTSPNSMWYAAAGPFAGKNKTNRFMVDKIELKWKQPVPGVPDELVGARITGHNPSSKSVKHSIIIEDGKVELIDGGKKNAGFQYNISMQQDEDEGFEPQDWATANLYGGNTKFIPNNSVLVYGHGIAGFSGLPDDEMLASPEDTMVWSNLNDGGSSTGNAYDSGSVNIDPDKNIAQVIQTQISRFYGNSTITDEKAYWSNWLPGGSGTMKPIAGGNNVILYFDPNVELAADIKDYVDTEYLRPKSKKLDIKIETGKIPVETDEVGVISYEEILDEDGDIEDELWNSYVEFNIVPESSTNYYTGRDTTTKNEINMEKIMLPGDESKLRFKIPPYGEQDIINATADGLAKANSISYITYDKSTVEYLEKDENDRPIAGSSILVPQIKVFFRDGTSLTIPDEEGEFKALDFNDEDLEGEVEGAELKPPQPKIVIKFKRNTESYEQLEKQRRNKNLAPKYTYRQGGDVATKDIAIKIGSKYYVVGTVKGKSVLLTIDLNME